MYIVFTEKKDMLHIGKPPLLHEKRKYPEDSDSDNDEPPTKVDKDDSYGASIEVRCTIGFTYTLVGVTYAWINRYFVTSNFIIP